MERYFVHVLIIVNNVAVNLGVQISLQDIILRCSLRYILRSVIFGYYAISIFNFLRNFHIASRSVCVNLHPHQQCTRVPISPHPDQPLLFLPLSLSFFFFVKRHHWFNGYLIGEFTCLKQDSGATSHHMWQMVGRTW